MSSSLDEELDRLYQRPLDEFVTARNELARSLKKSGDAQSSGRVKALSKPSLSAWAVNQLYWRARGAFDALVEAGDRYRAAQSESLAGGAPRELAEADEARREALAEARNRIGDFLHEAGENPGASVFRRIATTLEALVSYGSANPEPWKGRGSRDLEPPGFRALSSLPATPARTADEPPSATETATREAEDRERALRDAEEAVEKAESALERSDARARKAQAELQAARDRLLRAEEAAATAESELEQARIRLEERRAALETARRLGDAL